jgi:hypothetical protein
MATRWDETWHRLREWTNGQGPSERLAAQILLDAGYQSLDPSHPLGGKDGGKDAICLKNGQRWIMAAFFPRGQQQFAAIKSKFVSDLAGVSKNGASGMAFVTNQELSLAERKELSSAAGSAQVDLFHLERVTGVLDQPKMAEVRRQFLGIDHSEPRTAGPLTILYDEARHCFREENKQCAIYRIAVRNEGQTTINNVGVKIRDITSDQQPGGDDLRRLVGLRLSVSVNPSGLYSHPSASPDSTLLLHPGDEAIFDFVRLCTLPGNYLICHSSFIRPQYKPSLDQIPSGVLLPGKYAITLSAQGDNLGPVLERFEVASTATEVLFQRVAVAVP